MQTSTAGRATEPDPSGPGAAGTDAGSRWRRAGLVALGAGVLLRIALAVVNLQANDDHLAVVRYIIREGSLPVREDLWQGYQPKLFHVTIAGIWEALPISDPETLIRIAQLVSCAAGLATLYVVWRFVAERGWSPPTQFFAVAFVALNPALIGVNGQASNDSFAILFCTVALWQGARFFTRGDRPAFWWMLGATVLAGLTKGQGIILFLVVTAVFVAALVWRGTSERLAPRDLVRLGLGFVVVFLVAAAVLGPYRDTAETTGSPLSVNLEPNPFPPLTGTDETECRSARRCFRPGTESIVATYLAPRFDSLLIDPYTDHGADAPVNRTSLWARLYGGAHSTRFEQWPSSWADRSDGVLGLTRVAFVLAIFPTVLLVIGLVRSIVLLVGRVRRRGVDEDLPWGDVLVRGAALALLGALVIFTMRYRDFGNLKAIYLLPALLGFTLIFGAEVERFFSWTRERHALRVGAISVLLALLAVYAIDATVLVLHLA